MHISSFHPPFLYLFLTSLSLPAHNICQKTWSSLTMANVSRMFAGAEAGEGYALSSSSELQKRI